MDEQLTIFVGIDVSKDRLDVHLRPSDEAFHVHRGAKELETHPAVLDVPVGRGRVVAFDFDPIHRYQTTSDFRLVWNVLLNWNDLPPTPAPAAPPN